MFTDDELIKKKDIFDTIEDDDDIDWKHNTFDVDSVDGSEETPEQLMSQITNWCLRAIGSWVHWSIRHDGP